MITFTQAHMVQIFDEYGPGNHAMFRVFQSCRKGAEIPSQDLGRRKSGFGMRGPKWGMNSRSGRRLPKSFAT